MDKLTIFLFQDIIYPKELENDQSCDGIDDVLSRHFLCPLLP